MVTTSLPGTKSLKSLIFQSTTSNIWRISALSVLKLNLDVGPFDQIGVVLHTIESSSKTTGKTLFSLGIPNIKIRSQANSIEMETKVRWRFRKILWPPQNIWTLRHLKKAVNQKQFLMSTFWRKIDSIEVVIWWNILKNIWLLILDENKLNLMTSSNFGFGQG